MAASGLETTDLRIMRCTFRRAATRIQSLTVGTRHLIRMAFRHLALNWQRIWNTRAAILRYALAPGIVAYIASLVINAGDGAHVLTLWATNADFFVRTSPRLVLASLALQAKEHQLRRSQISPALPGSAAALAAYCDIGSIPPKRCRCDRQPCLPVLHSARSVIRSVPACASLAAFH